MSRHPYINYVMVLKLYKWCIKWNEVNCDMITYSVITNIDKETDVNKA